MPANRVNSLMINVMLFSCSSAATAHPLGAGESGCDNETESHEEETQIMLSVPE